MTVEAKRMLSTPLSISVIIPCYCCAETIVRAVDSVAWQTMLPKQIILIDDASSDDGATLRKLHALQKKYADKLKIEVIHLKVNGGPSIARNAGWDAATQPYIAFLDADDSWLPQKLEVQYQWMNKHLEVDLCGHLCRWGCVFRRSDNFDLRCFTVLEIEKRGLLFSNAFSTPTVMIKSSVDLRFPEDMRYAEDYYLWLKVVCQGYRIVRLEAPLAVLHKPPFGASGLSAELWQMEKGVQEVFSNLYQQGLITIAEAWIAHLASMVKFIGRIFRAWRFRGLAVRR